MVARHSAGCACRSGKAAWSMAQSAFKPDRPRWSDSSPARLRAGSTVKAPICPSSRARHVTCNCVPGCRVGAILRDPPPRTTPAWRPCAGVNTSMMAADSPCGLTESNKPSSRHSMPRLSRAARGRQASVRQPFFLQQGAALTVLDLDQPQVAVPRPLAGQ